MSENSGLTRLMFVCHGNICRSPMAEFIMKDLVTKAGIADCLEIASCATSNDEIGNDVYPPAKRCLDKHKIPYERRRAVRLKASDYDKWDLFVCMDTENLRSIERIFSSDAKGKVHRLGEYARAAVISDIADPWYTGDFEKAYTDIAEGCSGLLEQIMPPDAD